MYLEEFIYFYMAVCMNDLAHCVRNISNSTHFKIALSSIIKRRIFILVSELSHHTMYLLLYSLLKYSRSNNFDFFFENLFKNGLCMCTIKYLIATTHHTISPYNRINYERISKDETKTKRTLYLPKALNFSLIKWNFTRIFSNSH